MVVEILLLVIGDVHHQSIVVEAHDHHDVDQELDREVPQIIHGIGTVVTRDQVLAALDSNFFCTYKIRTESDQFQFILVGHLNILSKTIFTDSFDWQKSVCTQKYNTLVHGGVYDTSLSTIEMPFVIRKFCF